MRGQQQVLCLQDGSDLNFATRPGCVGLEASGRNQTGTDTLGLHLTLATTPQGLPLGAYIPIDREHLLCLAGQGRARGGSEPRERTLPGKEFAMPIGRIGMHVMEEALRLRNECDRSQRRSRRRAGCRWER